MLLTGDRLGPLVNVMKAKSSDLVRKFLEQRDGLLTFIFALTRDRDAAEDIFQETGIAVVEEAGRGIEVAHFLPWLHEIARRRVADYFRRKSRRGALEQSGILEEVVSLAFVENAEDPAEVREGREHLDECLEELPPSQRELIERRYREQAPLRDIAEAADSTEGSVKVLLWRARRQLARCIEGKRTSGRGDLA
jgi:RNA polymerase sigma-70 factor (ECF subfamily)